jgi:hypothetical protein
MWAGRFAAETISKEPPCWVEPDDDNLAKAFAYSTSAPAADLYDDIRAAFKALAEWQMRNDPVAALDHFPGLGAQHDAKWVDDPAQTVGERMESMRALALDLLTRAGHLPGADVERDTVVSATVWTGSTLADGTHRVLAGLATDLTRAGEDVHAAAVWRLARAAITSDAAGVLDPGEVLHRVRSMCAPKHIRPRIERAAAGIAEVLAPWPRERAAQLRTGATVRAHMTVGYRVQLADVVADTVDTLGCGCRRIRATRPDGDSVELLTGCAAHPCEMETAEGGL